MRNYEKAAVRERMSRAPWIFVAAVRV